MKSIDQRHHPIMYTIKDENGEQIEDKFYSQEIQVVNPSEWFAVERVIRKRGTKSLVKFIDYPG